MEKTQNKKMFCSLSCIRKRVFYVFLTWCTVLFFTNGAVFGQAKQKMISMKVSNMSVLDALYKVNHLSGNLVLFLREEVAREDVRVSIDVENMPLLKVVEKILEKTSLACVEKNGRVIVTPEKKEIITIRGVVTDQQKQPLPGVTVRIKGLTMGTVTDKNGRYELSIPKIDNLILVYSFIGMETVEMKYTGAWQLNVTMKEEVKAIDEVVVTGYQEIKEKGMTGSYSKIKAEDLSMTGTETVESMLQGKLPGMTVINTSGLTGTRQKVRVRGTSTLVGNAEPVWVVDGIIQEDNLPFESSELTNLGDNIDMMRDFIGGAISWLNPNDIDDITVLKDASATAIYGVKAANGVILITTKKGERGRMSLNYSGNFTTSQRMNYNRQEVMNSKERVALSREAFERGARVPKETVGFSALSYAFMEREISWDEFNAGVKKLETNNTDWFDILYRTPFSQSHSISFSGGNNDATYRASFGYGNVKNTAIGNDQTTYTGSLATSFIFWKKLTVSASLSGSHQKTKAFAAGVDPFSYAINTSRVISCFDDDGELFYYDKGGYNYNILNELANSGNKNTQNTLTFNMNARWRLIEDFSLSVTLGGSTSNSFAETWYTEQSHYITSIRRYEYGAYGVLDPQFQDSQLPYGGMLSVVEYRNFNYTARIQGEYTKLFNGVHSVNLMAGVETRSNKYDGYSQTNYGYQPDRGKSFVNVPVRTPSGILNGEYVRTNPSLTDRVSNYFSYYATASYMYDNRYSINLSIRGDGSNRFGEQGKFLPVWSAGLRWNVTDEHWMQDQNLINNLAFTATLGYQGNVAENVSPNLIVTIEPVNETTGEFQMKWSKLPNPDLKWEKTLSVNLGANFALFNSKLNGSFNWYYKKTTDVITSAQVPYENGVTTMYVNDGHMENRGWDLALSVVPVRTKNFMWSLGTTFSGNDNKVNSNIETTGDWKEAVSGKYNKKGYPVGSFWAFRFKGLNPENGGPLFDLSRANTDKAAKDATEYMVYAGTSEPTFTMGLNMVFRWKRFSFPLNVYISRGNKTFLASPYDNGYSMMSEFKNASSELNKRWREPGDEKRTNIPSIPVGENCRPLTFEHMEEDPILGKADLYPLDAWAYSDARVVNAWYIRFNDLKLSYELPEKWIKGFADRVAVSFTATNPLQIRSRDFKGRDPEVALGNQPRSQNYSLGINVSF